MRENLSMLTVYDHPCDFSWCFVARRFELDQATGDVLTASTLDDLRDMLPAGLTRLARHASDDPNIVEVWI